MKKLAFIFAAVVAVSFASCGNKAQSEATESDSIVVEETVVEEEACCAGDSCTQDSTCCEAVAEAPVAE